MGGEIVTARTNDDQSQASAVTSHPEHANGRVSEPNRRTTVHYPQAPSAELAATPERPVKLTAIMAAYNEAWTVETVIREVLAVDFPCEFELIVVDDGSDDATAQIVSEIVDNRLRLIRHPRNLGKGTALRTGRRYATGTHIVPFDADGEYNATDLARIVEPVILGGHDVVIGTRAGMPKQAYGSLRYYVGNRVLTKVVDVAFHSKLTDLHTCLKLVSTELMRSLPLGETGFGADTEIISLILRRGIEPREVPINYHGRTRAEGKKIGWQDAVACVKIIGQIRLAAPRSVPNASVVLDLTGAQPSHVDEPS